MCRPHCRATIPLTYTSGKRVVFIVCFAERTGFLLIIRYFGFNLLGINTLKESSYDVLFIYSNVFILLSACKGRHFL